MFFFYFIFECPVYSINLKKIEFYSVLEFQLNTETQNLLRMVNSTQNQRVTVKVLGAWHFVPDRDRDRDQDRDRVRDRDLLKFSAIFLDV